MKNYEFVTMIQNIGDLSIYPDCINSRDVFLTLVNGFLYIKPGTDTARFYRDFCNCIEKGRTLGKAMYFGQGKHIPFNKCVKMATTLSLMNCIKMAFDEEYFDAMLETIDVSAVSNLKKNFGFELGLKQRQELSELLGSFGADENSFMARNSVAADDNFAHLMASIISWADANTAYYYAHMLLDLERALNINVFKQSNIEIIIRPERKAC